MNVMDLMVMFDEILAMTIPKPPTIRISKTSRMEGTIRTAWWVLKTTNLNSWYWNWQYWVDGEAFKFAIYNSLGYFFGRKFELLSYLIVSCCRYSRRKICPRGKRLDAMFPAKSTRLPDRH